LRFETGEASSLEKLTAKGKQEQVRLQLEKAQADYTSYKNNLERWMNLKISNQTVPQKIKSGVLPIYSLSDSLPETNPLLKIQKSQIELSEREIKLQRSQFLPDFNAQYANQQVNGTSGFYAWQVGIDIPIFFGSQRGKVQGAKVNQDIQERKYQDLQLQLNSSYNNLLIQVRQLQKQLEYYENEGLPLSEQLLKNADLLFYTGEIGYVEYIQNIDRAVEIKISWMDTLLSYNETILELNYLTGK